MSKQKNRKLRNNLDQELAGIRAIKAKKVAQPIFNPEVKADVEQFMLYCQRVHWGSSLPFPDISPEALELGKKMWENRRTHLKESVASEIELFHEEHDDNKLLDSTENFVCILGSKGIHWRPKVDRISLSDRIKHYNGVPLDRSVNLLLPSEDLLYAPLLGWADSFEEKMAVIDPAPVTMKIDESKLNFPKLHQSIYDSVYFIPYVTVFIYGFLLATEPRLALLGIFITIAGYAAVYLGPPAFEKLKKIIERFKK